MSLKQYARGLWAAFLQTENPWSSPNGMEENLRTIDDHLALYTLAPPQAPGTELPGSPADGDGQVYSNGTYATFNGGTWKSYPPRKGIRAVLAAGVDSWLNTGTSWEAFSVLDTAPAIAAAQAAVAPLAAAAQNARDQAQTAMAGAVAAGQAAGSFGTKAQADAALAAAAIPLNKGVYVTADGANNGFWVNQAGVLVRISTNTLDAIGRAVNQPTIAGQASFWPDQFFRRSTPGVDFMGRPRWMSFGGTASAAWSLVVNTIFKGKALRRTVSGNVQLYGARLFLDEIGAVPGDTVTIYGLFVGDGGNVLFPVTPRDASGVSSGVQQNGLTDSGATSIAATSQTPARMRCTFVVPANTASVGVYPYMTSAGKYFDWVALWGFKGDQTAGPAWPTYEDISDAAAYELATTSAGVASAKKPVDYAFETSTEVSASSTVVAIAGTGVSTIPRGEGFTGWGEVFTPAGVSFNALKIKLMTRIPTNEASKWAEGYVVVRTGPNPTQPGAPVVAVGHVLMPPSSDSVQDMILLLRDPITNALKTLSDASFTDNKYFLAFYPRNAAGGPAACGQPVLTLPNSQGQSYYSVPGVVNPRTDGWSATAAASNIYRVGFEHLLLTDPVEKEKFTPSPAFKADLGIAASTGAPDIVLPSTLYALEGQEFNLYYDNVQKDDASSYHIDLTTPGSVGRQQSERFAWVPTAAMVTGVFTYAVFDKRTGGQLATASAELRAAAANAGGGQVINHMGIGDSLYNEESIFKEYAALSAADPNFKVVLWGTRGTAPSNHEGRGGYTVDDYATAGRIYRRFDVINVVASPALNSATYTHNGSTYTVQEVAINGSGNGTVSCSVTSGPNTPLASGELTKSNGSTGDAVITFTSSAAVSGNPFWIGGALNFSQYLTNNGFPKMHTVEIGLGINDIFGQTTDVAAIAVTDAKLLLLDQLIANIKASDPGTKVILRLPSPPSRDQDAFGISYATGQTRARDKRNILIWSSRVIAKYTGQEANRIWIMPSNVSLDTVNDMPRTSRTTVNAVQSLFFEFLGLRLADLPTANATYVISSQTWTVVSVQSVMSRPAETFPLDEDATKHITFPARYSGRIEMVPLAVGASVPEIGTMTKTSGVGAATITYNEVDGGVLTQNNGVHPWPTGYRALARAGWALLKWIFS